MTRINTNVSSLIAQNTLSKSNANLQQSLTRLSTGLRINTGKDDPAGLIASENLRSDITAITKAISNTDRANEVIATADSGLGQASDLLNNIRGLVTEASNSGAEGQDQIAADQLQIDQSLKALNQIAQTVTFQGRKLLDGSLDFITQGGTNANQLGGTTINQANLGATGSVAVNVAVTSAATKASLNITGITTSTAAANATGALTLTNAASQASGSFTINSEATGTLTLAGQTFNLAAKNGGAAASSEGNAVAHLAVTFGAGSAATSYNSTTHTLSVSVTQAAGTANINNVIAAISGGSDFNATIGGATGTTTVTTGDDAAATFALTGGHGSISLTALAGGNAAGAEGNAVAHLAITYGAGSAATSYNATTHTLNVSVTQASGVATLGNIVSAINGGTDFTSSTTTSSATTATGDDGTAAFGLTGGRTAGSATITINAKTAGASANGKTVTLVEDSGITSGTAVAAEDNSGNVTVKVHGTVSKNAIADAITNFTADYTASVTAQTGDQNYIEANDSPPGSPTTLGLGADASGGLATAAQFELSGANGAEVLSFGAHTSAQTVIDAVNAVSDATGVSAALNGTTIALSSTKYGSSQFVSLKPQNNTSIGSISSDTRNAGTDVVATVNGITAKGDGNQIKLNTSTLDLTTTVQAGFTGTASFTITGGGALFQLGPEIVSNQQTRIGITSVNTSKLGGVDGSLFELASGNDADLATNPTKAASIVDEAINQVTSLRGRLGAFQAASLDTNKNTLNDTLVNLTEAQSSIRDADFAAESANLTRAQILVQSGTTVLGVANQNPQNVLALLRNA